MRSDGATIYPLTPFWCKAEKGAIASANATGSSAAQGRRGPGDAAAERSRSSQDHHLALRVTLQLAIASARANETAQAMTLFRRVVRKAGSQAFPR
jgi:hypothetical protein